MVEICAKILYQVELCRDNLDIMWGFSVEAELVENSDRQDELCCYVSRVEERSVAIHNGKYAAATQYISITYADSGVTFLPPPIQAESTCPLFTYFRLSVEKKNVLLKIKWFAP